MVQKNIKNDLQMPPLLGFPLNIWFPALFFPLLALEARILPQRYSDVLGRDLVLQKELR